MDGANISTLISSLGFPIVCCLILFFGCKYMLDNQQKNTDKMFEMYDKANSENREAIRACTEAINKLSDCIEDLRKE